MRKKGNGTALAMIAATAVVIIWSETFVSTKVLIGRGLLPSDIFFYRFLLAYIAIWFITPGRKLFCGNMRDELRMLLLGISGGSLYFLVENSALQYSTASNVSILVGSAPLLTAILMCICFRDEHMRPVQVLGSLVAFVGMAMVVMNGNVVLHLNPLGDMLAIGAALTWGIYSVLMKKVSGRYDVRFTTRKVFGYGLLTILPIFIFRPLDMDTALLGQPVVWGNLVYLGLVASLVCFVVWNWCLPRLGTVRTTNMIYCQPFFTMLISSIWLGERITWMAVAGTAILIGGMMLANSNNIPGHGEEH